MAAWMEQLSKGLSLVSLAVAVVAAWYALPLDKQMKELQAEAVRLDNALKVSEAELKRLEASRALSLELFKEVRAVLSTTEANARQEEAVRVLVESLAEDPFRWKLLQAIASASDHPEVRQKAEVSANFYQEEAALPMTAAVSDRSPPKASAAAKPYAYLRIDWFYCVATESRSKPLAEAAKQLRDDTMTGSWRIRALPKEINARVGYQIGNNVIRHNPDELRAAQRLQADLKSMMQLDVQLMEIAYPTPDYLSVFFCAGA